MFQRAGGKGAYGAIDAIGGAQSQKIVASLRKNGKYILYGALDTAPVQASNMDILAQTKVGKAVQFCNPFCPDMSWREPVLLIVCQLGPMRF